MTRVGAGLPAVATGATRLAKGRPIIRTTDSGSTGS
jgi:hypothetical protein